MKWFNNEVNIKKELTDSDLFKVLHSSVMEQLLCYSWLTWLLKQVNEIINRRVNYTYCEDKWNCVGSARGKHFNQWSLLKFTWLLSTLFWYCLVQNENMQTPPKPLLETLTWRGKWEVKQTVKPFSWRATGTIWLHTSQSVCQTVYNMHTWWGGVQSWKCLTAEDWCKFVYYKNSLNWLC